MKKIFVYVAVAALAITAISCQKENLKENGNVSNDGLVFTASIDAGMDTKTTLTSEKKVNWEANDEITINGVVYTAAPKSDDATKADFTKKNSGDADPTGTFNAFYPTGIQDGNTAGGTLPATQTYTAGKIANLPMFATSTTTSLSFKNICAVLAVKVTSADIATLKAIKVKSDKAMCGAFTVTDDKAVLTDASDASKAVTLVSSTALTLDATGITFYIAIPAQTYSYLEVYLSSDGTAFTQMMCTKKKSGLGAIASNAIYPIDYAVNAVQLWADGPFWATTNIGATAPQDYGTYFAYGDITGQTWNSGWSGGGFANYPSYEIDSNNNLKPAYDAAVQNWGDPWRMPTSAEFTEFKNKCTATITSLGGVNGVRFTGKGQGYTDKSIFISYGGSSNSSGNSIEEVGSEGYCWSSTFKSDPSGTRSYYFDVKTAGMYNIHRKIGMSVRPVCSVSE